MKKTIIITIAMLCVFGGAVVFGAGSIQNQWQKPRQDDANIEIKPVIDSVEEEIASYPYNKEFVLEEITEDMITQQEAAYISGTMFEYFWDDISMKGEQAGVLKCIVGNLKGEERYALSVTYPERKGSSFASIAKKSFIEPTTGELLFISRDEESFYAVMREDVEESWIDDNIAAILLEKSLKYAEKLGYKDCTEYAVIKDTLSLVTENKISVYSVYVKAKNEDILNFNYYDNEEFNYPLNYFWNITKTTANYKNLPELHPIPQ